MHFSRQHFANKLKTETGQTRGGRVPPAALHEPKPIWINQTKLLHAVLEQVPVKIRFSKPPRTKCRSFRVRHPRREPLNNHKITIIIIVNTKQIVEAGNPFLFRTICRIRRHWTIEQQCNEGVEKNGNTTRVADANFIITISKLLLFTSARYLILGFCPYDCTHPENAVTRE